ncbi:MAG: hypothetical protein FJX56_04235 [Alphaproteobacteria bacterium]|nr:hypothetical protein [Alphaproteobacteria bacterium]
MYTRQALRELGIAAAGLCEDHRRDLDETGYFIATGVLTPAQCADMAAEFDRLLALEGERGGHETGIEPGAPRVANIFNKTAVYDRCLALAPVLLAAHHLLGEIKVHGANLRDPLPGRGEQELHADVPKLFADDWWVVNAIILFDDMTRDNGPTRVVPGSHCWPPINVAAANRADWEPVAPTAAEARLIPLDLNAPYPGEIHVEAPRGAVIVTNSSVWHAGTRNLGGARRRVLHLSYTRRDLPQQLVQREFLTRALYERLSPAQRFLMDIEPEPPAARARSSIRPRQPGDWWK